RWPRLGVAHPPLTSPHPLHRARRRARPPSWTRSTSDGTGAETIDASSRRASQDQPKGWSFFYVREAVKCDIFAPFPSTHRIRYFSGEFGVVEVPKWGKS